MSGDAPAPAAPAAPAPAPADTSSAVTTPTTVSPATESGPKSTADIASQVVEKAARGPEPTEDEDRSTMTPAEIAAAERYTEEEKLLREFGFKRAKREDGTEHKIERSKVLAMIASGLKRGRDQWGAEKTTLSQQLQGLQSFQNGFAESLRGDPDQFIAYVAQHDPRYKKFLEPRQPAAPAHPQTPADTGEPQPDVDLGNGAKTFSPQGIRQWLDWAVEQRLEQRLAPINQEREEAKARQAEADEQQERRERVHAQVTEGKSWPNYADYEGDILKKLQGDTAAAQARGMRPRMTLKEAYLEVKAERLEAASDPVKVREKVIADLNAAPKSTAMRPGTEVPRVAGMRSTADIARSVMERSEGKR